MVPISVSFFPNSPLPVNPDRYVIELRRADERVERVEDISFDMLGDVLERLIDDGHWRQIRIDVLTQPSRKRCA